MLPAEVFKKIQGFHFKTRHLANDMFAGQYESAFKGRGMAFAEVREYQIGDDVRSIDWNVSARFDRPFVKVYHEERELTVILMLDLSGSLRFGTRRRFKRELLAEIAGMLAFLAIRTNDKVGALLFGGQVEKYIPPRKGAAHVWRLIKEVFTFEPRDPGTEIHAAVQFLNRVVKRHAIVFLITDGMDQGFEKSLRLAARKHDLTFVELGDPAEAALPPVGLLALEDPESGRCTVIDTGSRALQGAWEKMHRSRRENLRRLLRRCGIDHVRIRTDGSVTEPLMQLFARRRRRR